MKNGDVQAANLFTTQSTIAANDFVVLEDPKNNFAAQNVLPLINKAKATDNVKATLNAISAKLTTGPHEAQRRGRRRREAEPGDGGEELAVAERPGLIPLDRTSDTTVSGTVLM